MKKNILIILGIIATFIIIGIAGKIYTDNREEKKALDLLDVERQSVMVLKDTFADISEFKFIASARNDMTGSYGLSITMKNDAGKEVSFSFTFWKERNEIGSYMINDRAVQKKGSTQKKVHVIFSNNTEEDI